MSTSHDARDEDALRAARQTAEDPPGPPPPWVQAAAAIRARTDVEPRVGIVLGSGLGAIADLVQDAVQIPYAELPGFPVGAVAGHARTLHVGTIGELPVAVLQGRAHLYEGTDPRAVAVPVRALKLLGAEAVLLTNAAGSLRGDVGPGRLMALTDHIDLTGSNPLVGPNDEQVGPRFPALGRAYDPDLRTALHAAAQQTEVDLSEGVYLAVRGPSFETPAEIRAFKVLGADAVGMSTVPEAIAAVHAGLRVAAVSCITNLAEGMGEEELSHEGTLAAAGRGAQDLARLVPAFLQEAFA